MFTYYYRRGIKTGLINIIKSRLTISSLHVLKLNSSNNNSYYIITIDRFVSTRYLYACVDNRRKKCSHPCIIIQKYYATVLVVIEENMLTKFAEKNKIVMPDITIL